MGTYKTLFKTRMRLFWTRIREYIKTWVARCAHCVSYNVWRTRKSEMHFSWPITVSFWVMNVDLWYPFLVEDAGREKDILMSSMCNLTQFIVSSPTLDIDAASLAQLFVSNVIMSFGMRSVILIDDGSTFRSIFIGMCTSLNINHWCLSRGNHRSNSVEYYHRFLNKTQFINGND